MSAAVIPAGEAVFLTGSIRRHVLISTATNALGYMAVLGIDLLAMFYVSWTGDPAQIAAVSLTSKVLFFPYAVNIGLTTALVARVSRAIGVGHGREDEAGIALIMFGVVAFLMSALAWPFRDTLLAMFGAREDAARIASDMLALMIPANMLLAAGMATAGVLRALGDIRRSMIASLGGAVFAAVADPILILGLDMGAHGAAIATTGSRLVYATLAAYWAFSAQPFRMPKRTAWEQCTKPYLIIGGPAVFTQLALPVSDWYITRTLWSFGVGYPTAGGVFDRIMPLAFAIIFALTGAIGPILGQNLGARNYDRLRECLKEALIVTGVYAAIVWTLLAATAPQIASLFGLTDDAREFFIFLCLYGTGAWFSVAVLFVSNVVFNTLSRAGFATAFNWGRATLGTVPFVWFGSVTGGAPWAILGMTTSAALFAVGAAFVAFRLIGSLEQRGVADLRAALPKFS